MGRGTRNAAAGLLVGALALLGLTALPAAVPAAHSAAVQTFTATLSGTQEVPKVTTGASGSATVTLNDTEDQILVSVAFEGLSSQSIMGHIHGPAAKGKSAPVVVNFLGFPTGVTKGTYKRAFNVSAELVAALKDGLLYVNVHSANNPNGEIRGQLEPVGSQNGALSAEYKCRGFAATIVGTNDDDSLTGTPARDVIVGLGGNDRVRGLGGADIICGGPGDDILNGGAGRDRIYGGGGNDTMLGEWGDDRMAGGAGDDVLNGGPGEDHGNGGSGKNTLTSIEHTPS